MMPRSMPASLDYRINWDIRPAPFIRPRPNLSFCVQTSVFGREIEDHSHLEDQVQNYRCVYQKVSSPGPLSQFIRYLFSTHFGARV
jgi:hypothetical protein